MKGLAMINKNHVIGVLTAIIVIDEVVIAHINKRKFARLQRVCNAQSTLIDYFAEMLDKHEVPFTEFDQLIVNTFYENV